jgi:hypothetical protein
LLQKPISWLQFPTWWHTTLSRNTRNFHSLGASRWWHKGPGFISRVILLYCRPFVEVPNGTGIMQECIAFQLIWISLERTADCEIYHKREQLNGPKHLMPPCL